MISGNSVGDGRGGGIYCLYAFPAISNNVLVGNSAVYGGGIYCWNASPTISNNIIEKNSVKDSGGGILCYSGGSPTISNNVINGNSSGGIYYGWGGGICSDGSSPLISNNVLSENWAGQSGGGIACGSSSDTLINNIVLVNTSPYAAGIFSLSCSSMISNNIISGNSISHIYGGGGGIYCQSGSPTISNNVISGNSWAYMGGGIYCYGASPAIYNNGIWGNSASFGGGIFYNCMYPSPSVLSNNVLSGNLAPAGPDGIMCRNASPLISNNVLVNSTSAGRSEIHFDSDSSPRVLNSIFRDSAGMAGQVSYDGTGTPVVSNNNIAGGWAGVGSNNVDTDPQFVGVIVSGAVSALSFDPATTRTFLTVSGIDMAGRDLTGWVVQVGNDLGAPTACAYAPILSYTTDSMLLAGDATQRGATQGVTTVFTAPANWQIYDYHLQPGSPMKGLGLGPDDPETSYSALIRCPNDSTQWPVTYSALVKRFDGDGHPRFGAKCEIGPDEMEWDSDFPGSVWGGIEIAGGATVSFEHLILENGSGVKLDGAAAGSKIEHCCFFQQYGAGLDASGGTLASVTNTSATACWGPGIIAPAAALQNILAERNRGTGLTAVSAKDSQSNANWGHGFDLTGAAENLTADSNTTDGIRAASVMNSISRTNGGWGVRGAATSCDVQNNGATGDGGGILGSAAKCTVIANAGPGVMNGAQAIRCEVRNNATTGVLNVAQVGDCTITGNGGAGIAGATQVINTSVSDNGGPGAVGGTLFDTTLSGNRGAGALAPVRLSHCTVSRNASDGVVGSDRSGGSVGSGTINNSLVANNAGAGLLNLVSVNQSNILGNQGFAAEDTVSLSSGMRDFTGNYWGAIATDELTTKAEGANLSFINDVKDGAGAWNLNVWPYTSSTVPEAPRAGGPPWAWRVKPDLTRVTTIGTTTFTLTYTASMNTAINPSVTFGLDDPFQLRMATPAPGWISPTTWQGTHTIGTNTGDGINTIRISGAIAADGFPLPDDTSHQFYINTRDPFVANNGVASALGSDSMSCTWDTPAGESLALQQRIAGVSHAPIFTQDSPANTGYHLLMSQGNLDNFQRVNPAIILTNQYTATALTAETLYFFKVQRVEADGTTQDWTSIFYAFTLPWTPPATFTMAFDARALDVATLQPIAGAVVTLTAETIGQSITDANGQASLSATALPNTAYTVTVTHADYETATRQYTAAAALSDEFLLAAKAPQTLSATIHGHAYSAEDGLPIEGATIRAESLNTVQTVTASSGAYSLSVSALPNSFVSLTASAPGAGMSASACVPAASGTQQVDFVLRPYPPAAPNYPDATSITQRSIVWTWRDNASNEAGYEIFAAPGAVAPGTSITLTAANAQNWMQDGLSTNTQYAFQTRARNAGGLSNKTSNISRYTLAATPAAPVVGNPTGASLDVAIGAGDGNPPGTVYAIRMQPEAPGAGSGRIWVQANGSVGASAVWQTAAAWSTKTVTGLSESTVYSFTVKARNGDNVETALGTSASRQTQHLPRTLTYYASNNGSISGATPQTVDYGASGTAILAVANTGYHFVQWNDGATSNPRMDANVTTNITVTASFSINQYILTYNTGPNGSITGATSQTVNHGARGTTVTAIPAANYHFFQWSDGVLTAARADTNVTTNISVTAIFAINTHALTVKSKNPNSDVSITVSPLDNGGQGNGATQFTRIYNHNTTVTLTAPLVAPNGNLFYRWLIDGAEFAGNQARTVQVILNANRTMTAIYYRNPATLTVASQNPDSGIRVSVYPADKSGKTQGVTQFACQYVWRSLPTLTATGFAPNGYVFSKWLKDGADFQSNTYRDVLCSMDTDHTMTAVYAHPYNTSLLTVASSNPVSGTFVSVYPADKYSQTTGTTQFICSYVPNSMVTLTARGNAPNGYLFWKWLRDGADFPNNTYRDVLCSMAADHTMTAIYRHPANTALLTVASSSPASGAFVSVYPADKFNRTTGTTQFVASYGLNSLITLTARGNAPNGYVFWKWLRDGADFPNNTYHDVLCSMNGDHTMTAVYTHPANTALLTVASSNPASGAVVSLYPADKYNQTTVTTQFVASYALNSLITLTARGTAPNGNTFWKWLRDGADFPN
ncbi:MAG: right-handed parallel beta-helix repeat-containing protein, partial [Candidatus Sumerlaeota bacterium]|nr:right-handed parallel beta-helix repeat-containing protein [Candidatus Sumerlaeota bacterium]